MEFNFLIASRNLSWFCWYFVKIIYAKRSAYPDKGIMTHASLLECAFLWKKNCRRLSESRHRALVESEN